MKGEREYAVETPISSLQLYSFAAENECEKWSILCMLAKPNGECCKKRCVMEKIFYGEYK